MVTLEPSISLKTIFHASFGLSLKDCFRHSCANSSCHCLFAFLLHLSNLRLESLSFCWFSSFGCFIKFLYARFLVSIKLIKFSSSSENQSGLFLSSFDATSSAFLTICFSNSSSSTDGLEKIASSGVRFWKKSSTFS